MHAAASLGVDLARFDLDEPVDASASQAITSNVQALNRSQGPQWTKRKLLEQMVLGSRQPPIVGSAAQVAEGWQAVEPDVSGGFAVSLAGKAQGRVGRFDLAGAHNRANALAALAAARHAGVPVAVSLQALESFSGIKRRLETRGTVRGVTVLDDAFEYAGERYTSLSKIAKFSRYLDVDGDGIAARTLPGVGGKGAYFVRGSGHDKHAAYTEDSDAYLELVDRLKRKIDGAAESLPTPVIQRRDGAEARGVDDREVERHGLRRARNAALAGELQGVGLVGSDCPSASTQVHRCSVGVTGVGHTGGAGRHDGPSTTTGEVAEHVDPHVDAREGVEAELAAR